MRMWPMLLQTGCARISYWRDRKNREVDFMVRMGRTLTTIKIKSSRSRESLPGMEAFANAFNPHAFSWLEETASH